MTATLRSSWPWLLANVIGLSLFIHYSSWVWAPRGQEGLLGGPGDDLIWMHTAFPYLAASIVMNLFWFSLILAGLHRPPRWRLLLPWLLVVTTWVSAQMYNRSRSYTGAEVVQDAPRP